MNGLANIFTKFSAGENNHIYNISLYWIKFNSLSPIGQVYCDNSEGKLILHIVCLTFCLSLCHDLLVNWTEGIMHHLLSVIYPSVVGKLSAFLCPIMKWKWNGNYTQDLLSSLFI